jgi:hypothetical protein
MNRIKLKQDLAIILVYVVLFLVVIAIGFGGWFVARKVNYSLSYKSMVEQTVKDMVKDECLKERKK